MRQKVKLALVGILLIAATGSLTYPANALKLFSLRVSPGYTGFLRIQPVGEVKSWHR